MKKNLRTFYVPEGFFGVCVWKTKDGFLSDGDGYLSMEGIVGSPSVEEKMRKAAKYWMMDKFNGKPHWVRNARKVTSNELDDQYSRLISGKIPDEVDVYRQVYGGK